MRVGKGGLLVEVFCAPLCVAPTRGGGASAGVLTAHLSNILPPFSVDLGFREGGGGGREGGERDVRELILAP